MPFAAAAIDIDAPIDLVWNVILDFPKYAEWNPFIVASTAPKAPTPGTAFRLDVKWRNGGGASSGEIVTESAPYTLSYRFTGPLHAIGAVRCVRWQKLEARGNVTHYSTREDFRGWLTMFLPMKNVQDGFDRHAAALKARAESLAR